MARLMLRVLALALLLSGSTAVLAEPVTLAVGAWFAAASAVTIATVALTVLSTAYSIYGSIQAKKKARAQAQRAAEQEAANLKDRTATLLTADSPWAVIYGSPAPVGGSMVAMLTSGADDRFKHVVFVLAAHECDGVEAIYMGGDWVGNLDAQGYAGGAEFSLDDGVPRVETHEFTLAAVPIGDGVMSPDGYWVLPLSFDAEGFSLEYIRNPAGNDYGTTVILDYLPDDYSGRALKGPIGATGTISYIVNGGGSALNVQIHTSPGGVDTADPFLRAARPDLWTVDHKLSGYTYLVVAMNLLLERFQGGVPEITVKLRGKKVYDYRTGQTVYSRNPALCLADFIRSQAGYGADVSQIDIDAVVAAANACDVNVYDLATVIAEPATYGGSTARYTCDGMFRSDQDRDATRQQIEDSMVGASLESGGVWRILAGAWSTPVLSLTDDDMVMPTSVIQTCNVGTARYNGAKGTYVNAVRNGVTEDFVPYVNANFRAQDVKDKFLDTTLSFTGNHVRTQQISRVLVEQSRGGFVVQIYPKMFAWNLQPGDRVVLSNALYGFTNKTFRVQDWTYQAGTPVALQCVEDVEDFYDQVDETRADAAPNTQLPNPFLKPAPPLDLVVLSGESQMIQQDGVMVVRTLVRWAQSQDRYVLQYPNGVHIQWRQAGTAVEEPWQNLTLPGEATEQYLLGLEVNRVYVIRVAFVTPYASSIWSVAQHEVHGLEGPPNSVLGLDVRPEPTGIFAYWNEPDGIDLLGWSATQIRRGLTWNLAEDHILFDGRANSANLGWFPAGSQLVWAAHHNTTGKWSEPVFDTIEILPPKQPQPTITVENRNTVVIRLPGDYQGTQPLLDFEVLVSEVGADISTATLVDRALKTRFEFIQSQFGEKQFWIVARDVAFNRSAPGYATALTLSSYDSEIGSIRGTVQASIDELALLEMEGWLTADGKLAAVRAGVYEKIEEVVTDTTALASQYTAVTATVDEYQAIVSSKITTLADKQSSQALQINVVAAKADNALAGVVTETKARVTAVSALADQVTTVQSSVSTLSGTVQIQSNTLANLNGNVAAQHMIRTEIVTALGIRAMSGLSLGVSSTGGGSAVQSTVAVFAGQFLVLPDANATVASAPFRVEGGIVYIDVAKIKDADIGTLKVAGFALSISLAAQGMGIAALSFTVPTGQVWRCVARAFAANGPGSTGGVLDRYQATLSLTGAAPQIVMSSLVMVTESESSSTGTYVSPPFVNECVVDYGAGPHTITAQWTSNGTTTDSPLVTLILELQKRGA